MPGLRKDQIRQEQIVEARWINNSHEYKSRASVLKVRRAGVVVQLIDAVPNKLYPRTRKCNFFAGFRIELPYEGTDTHGVFALPGERFFEEDDRPPKKRLGELDRAREQLRAQLAPPQERRGVRGRRVAEEAFPFQGNPEPRPINEPPVEDILNLADIADEDL
jgi:hypothetical protein